MGNPIVPVERSIAQTDVTLAALRQPALEALLKEGRSSTFTSTAHRQGEQLTVETSGKGVPQSVMKITGDYHDESTVFNPLNPATFKLPNPGAFFVGNFKITDGNNRLIEKDNYKFFASNVDDLYSRPDKATIAFTRTGADGKLLQNYVPASSQEATDANGQSVRIATPTDGDPNCQLENIGNPGNHRRECEYIIRDPKLGDLSYNETQSTEGQHYYRSVVRDMKGKVLGIVEQSFDLDANGDITNVTTSARKPQPVKPR
jgi:hypothetical protein